MWFINRKSANDIAIIKEILVRILELLDNSNESIWSELNVYETKAIIKTQLKNINKNKKINIKKLNYLFFAAAPLQEISMANGWVNEYLELAEKFDKIS